MKPAMWIKGRIVEITSSENNNDEVSTVTREI